MKAIYIIILLFSTISFAQSKHQSTTEQESKTSDSMIVQKMLVVKLKKYQGKTIQHLLENDIVKLYNGYRFTDEPPGKLQSLDLTYPNGMVLSIYPYQKQGQAVQFSMNGQFDFEALKKIKIRKLVLFFEPTGQYNQL